MVSFGMIRKDASTSARGRGHDEKTGRRVTLDPSDRKGAAKRVSNTTGGIRTQDLPGGLEGNDSGNRRNKDGGVFSRHVEEPRGFNGTESGVEGGSPSYPDNQFERAATKVSDKHEARGYDDKFDGGAPKGKPAKGGVDDMYRGEAGFEGTEHAPHNSGLAAVKVAAKAPHTVGGMGGEHDRAQPGKTPEGVYEEGPERFSQKNKNLTQGRMGSQRAGGKIKSDDTSGLTGSSEGREAVGITGGGMKKGGGRRRRSFV